MLVNIILCIIPLIIPYTIFGENLSSIILSIVGTLYLIINKNRINVNKKVMIPIILLNILAIISVIFISPFIESVSGFLIYYNILIYYIAYSKIMINDKNKEDILKYIVIGIGILAIYYILVQGLYYKNRIYGNIGYANSYALLLLIGIYFNRIRQEDKFVDSLEIIFILGIFFTGSRTTLVLLILYLLVRIKQSSMNNIPNICEGILWALIQYVIYSSMGISSLIVLPIIIAMYIGIKNTKIKKYIYWCLLLCSVVIIISCNNNTIQRVRNISINNGSFQERLVFYEDSIKGILNKPLGHGLNMFQYKSYDGASAFYDVKYVHNSVLQISYDIGILGGMIFLILIIVGFIFILKRNKMILILYSSVFMHSLLDFDMSYSTFGIVLVMLIVLSSSGEQEFSFNVKKTAVIPIFIILIYMAVFEGSIAIGKGLLVNDKIQASNNAFSIANNICFDLDYRGYFNKAQGYKELYDNDGNDKYLQESLALLNKSIQINKDDPRVIWNITYIYIKLDNEEKVSEYMDELLTKERYNMEVYSLYYDYFNEKRESNKEGKYTIILNTIKARQEDALKELNSKAIYMKNQLLS